MLNPVSLFVDNISNPLLLELHQHLTLYIYILFKRLIVKQKKILSVLRFETVKTPPIWLMRQAGRYLKDYRAVREKAGGFLDLCYNSELAAEVTLQPIRKFGFDAAILFADILLVPQGLGRKLWFEPGEGPRLEPILNENDILNLNSIEDMHSVVGNVYETVKLVKSKLPKEKALIGFAGAPWTVATYMIAGKGGDDQKAAKVFMTKNIGLFDKLIEKITDATIEYLSKQIIAGVDVIKIFDSWAGSLGGTYFQDYVVNPIDKIAKELKKRHNNIPIIAFPKGAGSNYTLFRDLETINCIALDSNVSQSWAKHELLKFKCLQGNLDPIHLVTGGDELLRQIDHIKEQFLGGPYIFNLGHGITPDADPKNVEILMKRLLI